MAWEAYRGAAGDLTMTLRVGTVPYLNAEPLIGPLRDAEGRIVYWYLLQSDIDDRTRAESLLAGEKRLLELIARGVPSAQHAHRGGTG